MSMISLSLSLKYHMSGDGPQIFLIFVRYTEYILGINKICIKISQFLLQWSTWQIVSGEKKVISSYIVKENLL